MSDGIASVAEVFADLRAFQRTTSQYAFSRLYDPSHSRLRFLVADEVGLGKTLVARGVIAQVVEYLQSVGDKRVDIVYICSNQAIARQNLRNLNIAGDDAVTEADRFTMLANEIHKLERRPINLIAVTPGTSLDFGQSAGKFGERALLYAILQRVWGIDAMRGTGPERVFYLGIADDKNARRKLRERAATAEPTHTVIREFREQIKQVNERRRHDGRPTLKVEFNRLANAFRFKHGYSQHDRTQRNRFIVELRRALATVGIAALRPDLVILDEFQRFRTLLDPANQTWATRLAHELFDYREPESGRPTRTLLLSATPYRPYTTADDADGDSHFDDFVHTAKFLFNDASSADALRIELGDLRRSLLIVDRDGGESAALACQRVGDRLRPVMVRTERLASTPDRSGMLEQVHVPVTLERPDIDGYLAAAGAAELLGQRDVVEFWKSGPYMLNFMEGYALKNAFDEATVPGQSSPRLAELVTAGGGLLSWDDVSAYEQIDPANGRLRALTEDSIGREMWRLLWLPPSLPYYRSDGIFDRLQARAFTKRLVFSAWNLVPKVISAMLSYEAERHLFASAGELALRPYEGFSDRPDRGIDFGESAGRLDGMPSLNLLVPSVAIARLTDPLEIAAHLRSSGQEATRMSVEREVRSVLARVLDPLVSGHPMEGAVDQRWYWAAPLLLDLDADLEATMRWWSRESLPHHWTGDRDDDVQNGGFFRHLDAAQIFVEQQGARDLGRVPEDLLDVLVATALGSPALCALRALSRITGREVNWDNELIRGAARIAWGFRALFNSPDATAVVRAAVGRQAYWRATLEYGVTGHLQAVLDEYLHILKGWRGFRTKDANELIADVAETSYNALSLRTVNYATDIPATSDERIRVDRHTMRGRFAIRFGDQSVEGEQRQQRAQQASQAFNSPFWPFVLSTTSIGQEGLDFHLYSHAVVHWNLPSNPVDFEQREGRVHRYKGHAIRKNVASICGDAAFAGLDSDPWAAMFKAAAAHGDSDGEISPYWVFNPPGAVARIERLIPLYPMSSDVGKLERLLTAVATYRLSFGQPRQEELLKYLADRIPEEDLTGIVERLRVDISPVSAGD